MNFTEQQRTQIREWIAAHKDELLADIAGMIAIRSVSDDKSDVKPFGQGCRDALDAMLALGKRFGYDTHNYEYYVGSISKPRRKDARSIGMWGHIDVVPEGAGWESEPYKLTMKGNFAVGRGTDDNKGPAVASLYVMRCLDELGFKLDSDVVLFTGCSEETGMDDIGYYTKNYPQPDFNMIPDSGFPVCHAEKGILQADIVAKTRLYGVKELCGGIVSNMVPDRAYAVLDAPTECASLPEGISIDADGVTVRAVGVARHAAFPSDGVNAIRRLTGFLSSVDARNSAVLALLNRINDDFAGTGINICTKDEISGSLTCVGSMIRLEDGKPVMSINVRYPVTADSAKLIASAERACAADGYDFRMTSDSKPSYVPADNPAVTAMMNVFNRLTGSDAKPFVMGGGTYARMLDTAVAYGMGDLPIPEADKSVKFGGAHEHDEALYVPNLLKAMEIYALTLLEIDGTV